MPNINQLFTLALKEGSEPAISEEFDSVQLGFYWSSTTDKKNSSNSLSVSFIDGELNSINKSEQYYVRCVRIWQ